MRAFWLAAIAIGVLAGCASTDKEQEGAAVEDRTAAVTKPPAGPDVGKPSGADVTGKPLEGSVARDPLRDPKSILSQRSVFFDYDSYTVRDEFRPLVTAHAKYLADNRKRRIVIQGNTDERGSREYNISLGQRRADAVKQALAVLGVSDAQIETVSFGEEKPRASGTDEKDYAQNRRADIVYDGEQ